MTVKLKKSTVQKCGSLFRSEGGWVATAHFGIRLSALTALQAEIFARDGATEAWLPRGVDLRSRDVGADLERIVEQERSVMLLPSGVTVLDRETKLRWDAYIGPRTVRWIQHYLVYLLEGDAVYAGWRNDLGELTAQSANSALVSRTGGVVIMPGSRELGEHLRDQIAQVHAVTKKEGALCT